MCSRLSLKSSDSSDVPPVGRFKTHNFASNCEERERERKPTRCNNRMSSVSTCFGYYYVLLQENKDRVLLHMVYCAGSAGCGW